MGCVYYAVDADNHNSYDNLPYAIVVSNVDTVDILVRGQGGHGSTPHVTHDPIAAASSSSICASRLCCVSSRLALVTQAVVCFR